MRWMWLVLALAGCDSLFNLDPVPLADDARRDGNQPGADGQLGDAKPCTPIGHDEDSDGLDDACDSCPTVTSVGGDTDGDGLDNACDPDLGAGGMDKLLYATGFPNMVQFTQEFPTHLNANWSANSNGQVTLFASALVMSAAQFSPTRIEIRTSQVGNGMGANASVLHSGMACEVDGADCSNIGTSVTCLRALPGGEMHELATASQNVREIDMTKSGGITCSIRSATSVQVTAATSTQFGTSQLQFTTSTGGALIIDSIAIYGEP